jgi:threonyl-tRNA synthetase
MNTKIRDAQLQKIPYMLVVGDKEESSSTLSVRLRSGEKLSGQSIEQFKQIAKSAVENKS